MTEFESAGAGTSHHGYVERRKADVINPVPFGKAEKYCAKFLWKCGIEGNADLVVAPKNVKLFSGDCDPNVLPVKDK